MAQLLANGLTLEVERYRQADRAGQHPVILLIRGLGSQLIDWPAALIAGLCEAGFEVVVFDNRDAGLSQKMAGAPDYGLADMAKDALGVLDALEISRAHVLGLSMGGMILQQMLIAAPERILSATIVMSSSLAEGLSEPDSETEVLLLAPPPEGRDAAIEQALRAETHWSNPAYPLEDVVRRGLIARAYDRCHDPQGVARQYGAIAASRGWADRLAEVAVATLVVHGDCDPLLPADHGRDIAKRIPGAAHFEIAGMGHDLHGGVTAVILDRLIPFLLRQTPS
ncbi:MAG: alpha/beta hydrolase [Pseudomonadota bacterium]